MRESSERGAVDERAPRPAKLPLIARRPRRRLICLHKLVRYTTRDFTVLVHNARAARRGRKQFSGCSAGSRLLLSGRAASNFSPCYRVANTQLQAASLHARRSSNLVTNRFRSRLGTFDETRLPLRRAEEEKHLNQPIFLFLRSRGGVCSRSINLGKNKK